MLMNTLALPYLVDKTISLSIRIPGRPHPAAMGFEKASKALSKHVATWILIVIHVNTIIRSSTQAQSETMNAAQESWRSQYGNMMAGSKNTNRRHVSLKTQMPDQSKAQTKGTYASKLRCRINQRHESKTHLPQNSDAQFDF
jgi:hypothetical protein